MSEEKNIIEENSAVEYDEGNIQTLTGLQHIRLRGLFPCGEGAGYAGGIVSAAIDGERCADMLAEYMNN